MHRFSLQVCPLHILTVWTVADNNTIDVPRLQQKDIKKKGRRKQQTLADTMKEPLCAVSVYMYNASTLVCVCVCVNVTTVF